MIDFFKNADPTLHTYVQDWVSILQSSCGYIQKKKKEIDIIFRKHLHAKDYVANIATTKTIWIHMQKKMWQTLQQPKQHKFT